MRSTVVILGVVGLTSLAASAHAHPVPRLYTAIGPETAWDPLSSQVLVGGTILLGLGSDPERGSLLMRSDTLAAWSGDGVTRVAMGVSILYRTVLRDEGRGVWSLALGPGELFVIDEKDLIWSTAGLRGELGVRFGAVRFSAFALTGITLGRDVRVPWGGPFGLTIDLGVP